MKRRPTEPTKRTRLLQTLDHWTRERAKAIEDGDDLGRQIAERCRETALRELTKLRTR